MSLMGSTSGLCSAALFAVLYVIPCYTGGCYNGTRLNCLMSVMAFKSPLSPLLIQQLVQVNTLRPRQDGCHFADDTFKRIFLNENVRISIKISLKFVAKSPMNNIPALVQIMAWRRSGDKPLSEPMMVSFLRIYASFGLNELTKYQRITLLTFIVQMHGSLVDSPHKRPVMWTEFPSWHHHIQHNCSDNAQTRTLKKDTIAHPHTGAMGASYEYFTDKLLYYNKAITIDSLTCWIILKIIIYIFTIRIISWSLFSRRRPISTMEQSYMLLIQNSQYHTCWCPGNLRSQGISRHGID